MTTLSSLSKNLTKDSLEPAEYPSDEDLLVYNRLMFYDQGLKERAWTGDIYKTSGTGKFDEYAMVLTPRCNLAQK